MAVVRSSLLFGLLIIYAECLYIAEDGRIGLLNVQAYEGESILEPARLTRLKMEQTRLERSDQTVIVVPNQGSRQPYGYGITANRGPTVIVSNVPDQYNTNPYTRY